MATEGGELGPAASGSVSGADEVVDEPAAPKDSLGRADGVVDEPAHELVAPPITVDENGNVDEDDPAASPLPGAPSEHDDDEGQSEDAALTGRDRGQSESEDAPPHSTKEDVAAPKNVSNGDKTDGETPSSTDVSAAVAEEDHDRDVEEDSIDGSMPSSAATSRAADALERRPSIVSKTEIATSPGGTKTVKVGLRGHADASAADAPTLWDPAESSPPTDLSAGAGAVDEDEALLAAALAADMEREMQREEREQKSSPEVKCAKHAREAGLTMDHGRASAGLLAEKDEQIEALQAQLMAAVRGDAGVVDGLDAGVAGPDKRDAKIVALAKKNRSLNLALERQKTRIAQLEAEAADARKAHARSQAQSRVRREVSQNQSGADDEVFRQQVREAREGAHREYAERLADVEQRCDQMRQKCLRATSEAKRLKRVLAREVGDGPQLEKVLEEVASGTMIEDDSNGWRGRAQKIILLKDKLKRAQAQLAHLHQQHQHQGSGASALPEASADSYIGSPAGFGFGSGAAPGGGREDDVDARAARDIRVIEQERRHAMEKLAHEYEHVENDLAEAKRTIHAVRARGKVLEGENKRYKEQLKVLLKKTSNDDTLVDALRRELERLKRELHSARESSRAQEESSRSSVELEELKQHAMNQAAQIERQGQLLVKMRTEMERVKASASRDIVRKAHEELDNQGHAVNSKLLKVENDRLGELVDLFKQKLERAVVDREAALGKCKKLERAKVELERRLGNIHAGGRKRQPMADQLSELRDQLALQVEETRVARASASQAISQKNEEIRILREMGVQVKEAYERAIEDMKHQVQQTALEAQRRIQSSECHVDDALLAQLTKDNEYLRNELFDVRDRKLSPTRSSPTFRGQHQHQHQHQQKHHASYHAHPARSQRR